MPMLSLSYITIVVLLSLLSARYLPIPTFTRLGFVRSCVLLSCFISAAVIGWHLPALLQSQFNLVSDPGWLTRMAQVVGAGGGFYIALRGVLVWGIIFVLGLMCTVIYAIINYIVGV